jgi:hypothetical protein
MTASHDTSMAKAEALAEQDRKAARLKAALKANIGRRKQQARARAGETPQAPED